MFDAIKKALLNTPDSLSSNKSSSALGEYYQSRLKKTNCVVEVEAILSMNELMTFDNEEEPRNSGL